MKLLGKREESPRLTVSESNRVILRELMPTNLIEEYVDTLSARDQAFSEKDIEEAKKLLVLYRGLAER